MRVLVTGAYGFLGSHIVAALQAAGCEVIGCGRNLDLARRLMPALEWRACDFNKDRDPEDWRPRLKDIDAVVNCVGIVQETRKQSLSAIHDAAPKALFKACAEQGIRRVIQISALGAGEDGPTDYATTKDAADEALLTMSRAGELDGLVLRPSLVYGAACYGGTALFRGLAGFPFFIPVMGEARAFQPIHMNDFTAVVTKAVTGDGPRTGLFNLTGPTPRTTSEILTGYRAWLGLPPASVWPVPAFLGAPILKAGDFIDWLGVRTPVTTTAYRQMEQGNTADHRPMVEAFGITPCSLEVGFTRDASSVTDRLHARTFFLKPLLIVTLGLYWILSGLIPLLAGFSGSAFGAAAEMFGHSGATLLAGVGALVDIGLGVWLLLLPRKRLAIFGQLIVCGLYLLGLTIFEPGLWVDPLAPLLKIIPIMAASLAFLALDVER